MAKKLIRIKCANCGKECDVPEALFCPYCATEFKSTHHCDAELSLSVKEAMRMILQKYGREIIYKDKKRFISLLKDYTGSTEEIGRIEYALTEQVIKLLYDADKKELKGPDSKINDVTKINNRLVSCNGFDKNAALEITGTLIYAFNWDFSIAATPDELNGQLRDDEISSTGSSPDEEKVTQKSFLKKDEEMFIYKSKDQPTKKSFLAKLRERFKHKTVGEAQPTKHKNKNSLSSEEMKTITWKRYNRHASILFYVYIASFFICLVVSAFFLIIGLDGIRNQNIIKMLISGGFSTVSILGAIYFRKAFEQTYKNDADISKQYLQYDAMEYFFIISQNGKEDIVKAILENFPKL